MAENNIWKKEKDLENARELVNEFEGKMSVEIRRQEEIEEKWRVKVESRGR